MTEYGPEETPYLETFHAVVLSRFGTFGIAKFLRTPFEEYLQNGCFYKGNLSED